MFCYHIGLKDSEYVDTFYGEAEAKSALNSLLELFPLSDIRVTAEKVPESFAWLFEQN